MKNNRMAQGFKTMIYMIYAPSERPKIEDLVNKLS